MYGRIESFPSTPQVPGINRVSPILIILSFVFHKHATVTYLQILI